MQQNQQSFEMWNADTKPISHIKRKNFVKN